MKYPHFDRIRDADFAPAFDRGMAEQLQEVAAIAANAEPPTFENTIVALEKSGALLQRTSRIFFNLVAADTNEERKKLQAEYTPRLAAHWDAIVLNPRLFEKVQAVHAAVQGVREALGLEPEAARLIERYHTLFVRSGAGLSDEGKARLQEMNTELAALSTEFTQKVMSEVQASAVVVETREELAGLSEPEIAAAAAAAKARGMEGKYAIDLQNTTGQPPIAHLHDRALRERIHRASSARGSRGNEFDTTGIVARMIRLRAERSQLLGYANHAAYVLEDETARTAQAVNGLLARLAPAAVANARREAAEIESVIRSEGESFELQPWDWAYYSEKVRRARYNFDESRLKPYLELNRVLEDGVFFAARRLYGITFKERRDLPVYHSDVRIFDVLDRDGGQLAIFVADLFARPSKRGGAWMNEYVLQSRLLSEQPVIANHMNITKPAEGQPALLTWDQVRTMFHEFGHALHGMFSGVQYPFFSGTNVPRDFVEYPSQVNEMWAAWPEVLQNYARHYETGEPLPEELLTRMAEAEKFNQGFRTTEYLAAALLDQYWYQLAPDRIPEAARVLDTEAEALREHGVDYAPVPPRYRMPYFSHIMDGYSAGYYSYIWSEVLDADTVEWFKENGGLTRSNGDRFRDLLLSRGGSADAMELFRALRGRDPEIRPLLERRGLQG